MHYFLNIGSNLGQRKLNITRALRALEQKFGYFETSHIIETEPQGYESPHKFLNIAVMVISDIEPKEMLSSIKEIESRLNTHPHRDESGGYADREVDIDIMAADDLTIESDSLTIPHKKLAERRFFLEPLAELAPLWVHPVTGLTCSQMMSSLIESPM